MADHRRRVAQGEHLGVGGRIASQLALVVATLYHLTVAPTGADRHVVVDERTRLVERARIAGSHGERSPALSAIGRVLRGRFGVAAGRGRR